MGERGSDAITGGERERERESSALEGLSVHS